MKFLFFTHTKENSKKFPAPLSLLYHERRSLLIPKNDDVIFFPGNPEVLIGVRLAADLILVTKNTKKNKNETKIVLNFLTREKKEFFNFSPSFLRKYSLFLFFFLRKYFFLRSLFQWKRFCRECLLRKWKALSQSPKSKRCSSISISKRER